MDYPDCHGRGRDCAWYGSGQYDAGRQPEYFAKIDALAGDPAIWRGNHHDDGPVLKRAKLGKPMVKLNRIYTRTGDDGTTGLGSGQRVKKYDLRVEAYGTVDETNACIGMVRLHTAHLFDIDAMLARIQNDLFDLGADLCTPLSSAPLSYEPLRVVAEQVQRVEAEIDQLNATLKPLKSFVLPGGSAAAASLHLARTICRRAERQIVELAARDGEHVGSAALHYVNRLSDFLFVASRYVNDKGDGDVLWVPGQNREG